MVAVVQEDVDWADGTNRRGDGVLVRRHNVKCPPIVVVY